MNPLNLMKIVFLMIRTISWANVTCAQEPNQVLDTQTGKNASYYWINYDEYYLIARNAQNTDTSRDMYFDNGDKVPWEWELSGEIKCTWEELILTIKIVLTEKEWET